jgi:hypothetical protein
LQIEKTKTRDRNNRNPTPIIAETKAVSSTTGATMQVEKTKKHTGNNYLQFSMKQKQ